MYPSLSGQHVFITGGGSGIGASIVEAFANVGSLVTFVDIDIDSSTALADRFDNVTFESCDIRNIETLRSAIEKSIEANGSIAVLVNNAASDDRHAIESVTQEYWDNCQNINLRPHFFSAQAVVEGMKALNGGSIINLSSNSFLLKVGGMPGYLASKAAIVGLTNALARDLGPYKIRVNAVLPGWIMTEKQRTLWMTPEDEKELLATQCLKELIYPEEIAKLVLFLASDQSRMITAQSLVIDAGRA